MRNISALVFAAVLAFSSSAYADESASDLVERGIELRTRRKDEEALGMFRRAYAISPDARTRVQIGLAEQALGLWGLAEIDLEAGLASRSDPWIAKNAATIEGALAIVRNHLGSIEVRANAEGAELFIDGIAVGRLPLPRAARLTLGTHRLEVRAPGFASSARTVELTSGAMLRETFELARESRTVAASPASIGAPASTIDRPSAGSTQRALGWTMVGVGVAAGAFAGVSFVVHQGQIRSYNDDASCPGRASATQPPSCADKIDSADSWLTIGIATAVGAGMLALGGLIVALTAPRDAASPSSRTVSCTLAGCGARF